MREIIHHFIGKGSITMATNNYIIKFTLLYFVFLPFSSLFLLLASMCGKYTYARIGCTPCIKR